MNVTPIREGIEIEPVVNQDLEELLTYDVSEEDKIPNWVYKCSRVSFPSHRISRNPIYLEHIWDANVVILIDHGICAVTYYNLDKDFPERIPEFYLPEVIKELKQEKTNVSLKSIIIAGDLSHFRRIKNYLAHENITVSRSYIDPMSEEDYFEEKSLAVNPTLGQVLMYSKDTGFIELLSPRLLAVKNQ